MPAGMDLRSLDGLTRVLQASISPVVLVSGVGLLVLSFSNRFARVTDLLRGLLREAAAGTPALAAQVENQVQILLRRAHLLRLSIACAMGCVLLVSLVVLGLFVEAVLDVPLHLFILLLFALSLVCLVASVALFLRDMQLSLRALQEEVRRRERRVAPSV